MVGRHREDRTGSGTDGRTATEWCGNGKSVRWSKAHAKTARSVALMNSARKKKKLGEAGGQKREEGMRWWNVGQTSPSGLSHNYVWHIRQLMYAMLTPLTALLLFEAGSRWQQKYAAVSPLPPPPPTQPTAGAAAGHGKDPRSHSSDMTRRRQEEKKDAPLPPPTTTTTATDPSPPTAGAAGSGWVDVLRARLAPFLKGVKTSQQRAVAAQQQPLRPPPVEEIAVTPEALLLRLEAVERELAAFRDREGQRDNAAPPPPLVTGWVGFLSSFVTALLPAAPPGDSSKGKDSTGST